MRSTRKNKNNNKRPSKNKKANSSEFMKDMNHAGVPQLVINRSLNFMPDRLRTTLSYNGQGTLKNVGVPYSNSRLRPTFVYDVDPVIGSTAVPGHTELSSIYGSYRVNWFRQICAFSNNESFAECVYLCPLQADPGANTTAYQALLSNKRCVKTLLGPDTGACCATLDSGRIGQDTFAGLSNRAMTADYSSGSGTTGPTDNLWIATGFYSAGSNSVNGVYVTTTVYINVDYFNILAPAV